MPIFVATDDAEPCGADQRDLHLRVIRTPPPPPPDRRDPAEPSSRSQSGHPRRSNAPTESIPSRPSRFVEPSGTPGWRRSAAPIDDESVLAPPPPVVVARAAEACSHRRRDPSAAEGAPTFNPSIRRSRNAARIQGIVIIEATIGADGQVVNARVLRSVPLLDQAALDAVRQWQFTPTLLNGVPVPVIMTVTVTFTLSTMVKRRSNACRRPLRRSAKPVSSRDEHHADDRRAARPARDLHGRAAVVAARPRRPSSGGNRAPNRRRSSIEQIMVEYFADRRIEINHKPVSIAGS